MDIASIGGIALAIIGILAGMMVEGGSISQITQPTAAMIVIGGTVGAVMLQFPLNIFLAALKQVVPSAQIGKLRISPAEAAALVARGGDAS